MTLIIAAILCVASTTALAFAIPGIADELFANSSRSLWTRTQTKIVLFAASVLAIGMAIWLLQSLHIIFVLPTGVSALVCAWYGVGNLSRASRWEQSGSTQKYRAYRKRGRLLLIVFAVMAGTAGGIIALSR